MKYSKFMAYASQGDDSALIPEWTNQLSPWGETAVSILLRAFWGIPKTWVPCFHHPNKVIQHSLSIFKLANQIWQSKEPFSRLLHSNRIHEDPYLLHSSSLMWSETHAVVRFPPFSSHKKIQGRQQYACVVSAIWLVLSLQFLETANKELNNVIGLLLGIIGLVFAIVELLRSTLFTIHCAVPHSKLSTVCCCCSTVTQSTVFTQPSLAIPPLSSSISGHNQETLVLILVLGVRKCGILSSFSV